MRKTTVALGLAGVLLFGTAASCQDDSRDPDDPGWYITDFPDCDADDRSPKWEVSDCGPSPRPMKTAYQPAPSKKPTTAPKPRTTRK